MKTGLNGRAPLAHTHTIAQVTGLEDELTGKAATVHTHEIAEITDLQSSLDAKIATADVENFAKTGNPTAKIGTARLPTANNTTLGAVIRRTDLTQNRATDVPSVGAVTTALGNKQDTLVAGSITTALIAADSVTEEKLSEALRTKIDNAGVGTAVIIDAGSYKAEFTAGDVYVIPGSTPVQVDLEHLVSTATGPITITLYDDDVGGLI